MSDDGGVMGNLPRSRPGRRSEKRQPAAGGGAARRKPAAKAAAPGATRKGSGAARAAPGSARERPAGRGDQRPRRPASRQPDPVGDVVRAGAKIAGAGLGVAAGVLRRLPRP
jgi:hypothetical protein